MVMNYATIAARITEHDTEALPGTRATLYATPQSTGAMLTYNGDTRLTLGTVDARFAPDGTASILIPLDTDLPGLLWTFTLEVKDTRGNPTRRDLGTYAITGNATLTAMVQPDILAVDATFQTTVASYATRAESAATRAEAVGDTNDTIVTGLTADAASLFRAALTRTGALPVGRDELVVEAATRGLPTDGITSASPAIAQTIADARAVARFTNGSAAHGLPTVRIPKGRYRIGATLLLEMLKGFTLQGDGMGSTVLYVDSGITLLDLHRANAVRVQGLTLVASRGAANPGGAPWTDSLIEGSTGVLIRERSDDPVTGVSTTGIVFEDVELVGFHRAVVTQGNQMGDDVTFIRCRWRDNFYAFDHANGQSINWRVLGGEVLGFVDGTEADYNTLLAAWSAGSKPVTAPGAAPTVRDGAVVRSMAGGGTHFIGTSFITRHTRVLIGGLPTVLATAVGTHGVEQNYAQFVFDATSSEIREVPTEAGDTYGCRRSALIRYERPHPAAGDKTNRVSAGFRQERFVVQQPTWDALHLTNGVKLGLAGCTIVGAGAAAARLVSLVTATGSTAADIGRLHSVNTPMLTRARVGRQPGTVGAAWTPPALVDHDIEQETGQVAASLTASRRVQDRTLVPGVTRQRQIAVLGELDGSLPAGTARRAQLPVGAVVLQVTILGTTVPVGRTYTWEFRTSAGAVLGALTLDPATPGAVVSTMAGRAQNGGLAARHDLMTVLNDGIIDVIQTGVVVNYVSGHVLVEYL